MQIWFMSQEMNPKMWWWWLKQSVSHHFRSTFLGTIYALHFITVNNIMHNGAKESTVLRYSTGGGDSLHLTYFRSFHAAIPSEMKKSSLVIHSKLLHAWPPNHEWLPGSPLSTTTTIPQQKRTTITHINYKTVRVENPKTITKCCCSCTIIIIIVLVPFRQISERR